MILPVTYVRLAEHYDDLQRENIVGKFILMAQGVSLFNTSNRRFESELFKSSKSQLRYNY